VIVLELGTDQSDEVAFAEYHDMLEELVPAAADPAFGDRVLPRTPVRRSGGFGAHGLHESHHRRTEDRVPIEQAMPRRAVVGERLAQLLDHPDQETCSATQKARSTLSSGGRGRSRLSAQTY